MISFLLILFIIFIVWPIVRIGFTVYTMHRKARKAFESMYGRQADDYSQPRRRKAGWTEPKNARRKVFARDTGEYVAFQEISAERTTYTDPSTGSTATVTESQVTDVEWEEIK